MPIRFAQQFFASSLGKFLLVGGLATAAQFATLFALVELGLCSELTASVLG